MPPSASLLLFLALFVCRSSGDCSAFSGSCLLCAQQAGCGYCADDPLEEDRAEIGGWIFKQRGLSESEAGAAADVASGAAAEVAAGAETGAAAGGAATR